jgi:gluconate kinase
MPARLLYLFGLPGSGKNFVGELLQSDFGFNFHDGDEWLPLELQSQLKKGLGFTEAMRDQYYDAVGDKIEELLRSPQTESLVIAQATFRNKHRRRLLARFPQMMMAWVKAERQERQERLKWGGNRVDEELGLRMERDFELPDHSHAVITNSASSMHITREQLRQVISSSRL